MPRDSTGREVRSALKNSASASATASPASPTKSGGVRFAEADALREVKHLPEHEMEDAMRTRSGSWQPAPDHDEFWDGDELEFWPEEKTQDEVKVIVVLRQMRMSLLYNLGFVFHGLVSNFKRRHGALSEDELKNERVNPRFESAEEEEAFLRRELRGLFTESIKGLDYEDVVDDRNAFESLYRKSQLSEEALSQDVEGAGLRALEAVLDEILDCDEVRVALSLEVKPAEIPSYVQTDLGSDVGDLDEEQLEIRKAELEAHNKALRVTELERVERLATAEAARREAQPRRRRSIEEMASKSQERAAALKEKIAAGDDAAAAELAEAAAVIKKAAAVISSARTRVKRTPGPQRTSTARALLVGAPCAAASALVDSLCLYRGYPLEDPAVTRKSLKALPIALCLLVVYACSAYWNRAIAYAAPPSA